jgi:CBS domain containing-hemolysin-like protein
MKIARGPVDSIHLLFTPISLPKLDIPEEFEQELLDSVEEFGETIVREIMVPRIDMATVVADSTLSKSMSVFLSRGYSRLPVIGKNIDDISGILYLKDVARILHESPSKMDSTLASEIARPVIYVPESKPVDDLLRDMQLSSTHIAVIIDEYGGVAGLATMEDVIEEIVGDISDEYDREVADVDDLGDGRFRVNARFSLAELGEQLELELEDEDVDSIGGLFTKELGRLPSKGDEVTVSGLVISADRIEGRRKRLITVILKKDESLADAQSAFEQLEPEK